MRKYRWPIAIFLTVFLIVFLSAEPSARAISSEDYWPMFRHDPAHTGYTNSTAPTTAPVVLWSFQTTSGIGGSPAVADGYVYVTSGSYLHCLNASTGTQIWATLGTSSPAVYNGLVYTGLHGGTAYYTSTGEIVWNAQTDSNAYSPVVVDGVVYIENGALLCAYNASTGELIWGRGSGDSSSPPVVANGYVYCGRSDVRAFNVSTGAEIWQYTPDQQSTQSYREGSPAVSGGYLYTGLLDSFYCFDALTGTKMWNYTKGALSSSPAIADGYVYFGGHDSNVYALNASTGQKIWNYTTGYLVDSSPAVAGGVVYVGSGDGNLYALNSSTGTKLWNFTLQPFLDEKGFDRYMFASPAIAGGVIYMGSTDGVLYALGTISNTTTSSTPSTPIPEFPNQLLGTTLFVSLLLATSVAVIVKKRTTRKTR